MLSMGVWIVLVVVVVAGHSKNFPARPRGVLISSNAFGPVTNIQSTFRHPLLAVRGGENFTAM